MRFILEAKFGVNPSILNIFTLQGLKTGMYYLRTKPAASAIQFTVDQTKLKNKEKTEAEMCSLINREACMSCSG